MSPEIPYRSKYSSKPFYFPFDRPRFVFKLLCVRHLGLFPAVIISTTAALDRPWHGQVQLHYISTYRSEAMSLIPHLLLTIVESL